MNKASIKSNIVSIRWWGTIQKKQQIENWEIQTIVLKDEATQKQFLNIGCTPAVCLSFSPVLYHNSNALLQFKPPQSISAYDPDEYDPQGNWW